MTDRPFEYDVSLFELCAMKATSSRSSSSAQLLVPAQQQEQEQQEEEDGQEDDMEEVCRVLWQGHDRHYGHNRTKEKKGEQQQRLDRFVQNVAFVHEFNSPQPVLFPNQYSHPQQQQQHEVSLNQFADWLPSELPLATTTTTTTTTTTLDHRSGSFVDADTAWDHMWDASVDPASLVWDDTNDTKDGNNNNNNNNNNGRNLVVDRPVFVRLEEESSIRRFAPTQPQPWLSSLSKHPPGETVRLPQSNVNKEQNKQHDSSDDSPSHKPKTTATATITRQGSSSGTTFKTKKGQSKN
eukprot:scaffold65275_cov40-Attheya_sp.AAC.1